MQASQQWMKAFLGAEAEHSGSLDIPGSNSLRKYCDLSEKQTTLERRCGTCWGRLMAFLDMYQSVHPGSQGDSKLQMLQFQTTHDPESHHLVGKSGANKPDRDPELEPRLVGPQDMNRSLQIARPPSGEGMPTAKQRRLEKETAAPELVGGPEPSPESG